MNIIGNDWDEVLQNEYQKPYFKELIKKVDDEYLQYTIYPPKSQIYTAMKLLPYKKVKVVILGQDPYHGENQANGIAFAVNTGIKPPPSLINIFKEIQNDIGAYPHGTTLVGWAKQGVLLLNTGLTVRQGSPQSHFGIGWQTFTDEIIRQCSLRKEPMVFILWGANAIAKKKFIASQHLVLTSAHPSPLSAYRGFFGSKPFSKANAFLKNNNLSPIDWLDVDGENINQGSIIRV